MFDPKTKARIAQEARASFAESTEDFEDTYCVGYIAGAEAEAERETGRVQGLISALQSIDEDVDDILLVDPANIAAKSIRKEIHKALTNYNNPVNK